MKDKILQLCKRLNKFSLDEIVTISEIDGTVLKKILDELVTENKLYLENGGYSYNKQISVNRAFRIFQHYDKKTVDIILRAFCSEIPSYKAAQIAGVDKRTTEKFYTIFRTIIYNRQKNLLDNYYSNSPQNARHRVFFDKEVYLYFYEGQVFISKNLLKSKKDKSLNETDRADFTTIYCYLTRNLTHNKNEYYLEYKIAEIVWRRNQCFKNLYSDLLNFLFQ